MQCPACRQEIQSSEMRFFKEIETVRAICGNCGAFMHLPFKRGIKLLLREAVRQENNILACKCIRALTDCGLRDAKDMLWAILDK